MTNFEKRKPSVTFGSINSSTKSAADHRTQHTHHTNDLEDYFKGPRDPYRHSKLPFFLRMHGSILPKMIVPLFFVGCWATAITCISQLVCSLKIQSVLLTVTGFVVGLALSFRSTTAYERYSEGRRYWSQLLLTSRNLARIIWVHGVERHAESAEMGKKDVLRKLAAINLLNAFAVSLKHRLRFEPSTEYPDLAPLVCNLHTLAGEADQTALRERKVSSFKAAGQYLGVSFAESNPRKMIKRAKDNLGNTPLEVLTYLSCYIEKSFQDKTLPLPSHQALVMNLLNSMAEVLTGVERVVNTPLPIAYSISISQITWAYVLALPFQLVEYLGWVAIPGTIIAGYIILGLAQIGHELENPFGQDVNDLPLDAFCQELANDIDAMTSEPPPLDIDDWMSQGGAKVLWPFSGINFQGWEGKSMEDIRKALKAKATSREVKMQRQETMILSDNMDDPIIDHGGEGA